VRTKSDVERHLADAREALACGALPQACDAAWYAAAGAAQLGNEETLAELLQLATTLERQTEGREHDEAARLLTYVTACLEDAQRGVRPLSAFEQLMRRDRRPR
jgi:hypothetical protein